MSRRRSDSRSLMGGMMRIMSLGLGCREMEARIPDYLEGRLSGSQRARFLLHLAICRVCRRYLAAYRRAVALARAALRDAGDEALPDALVRKILAPRGRDAP